MAIKIAGAEVNKKKGLNTNLIEDKLNCFFWKFNLSYACWQIPLSISHSNPGNGGRVRYAALVSIRADLLSVAIGIE